MSKIYIDQSGIDEYVKDELSLSITNLKNASSLLSNLSIPKNFKYKDYLKNLNSIICENYNDSNDIYDKIFKFIGRLEIINNNFSLNLINITNYKVDKRLSGIK